MTVYQISSLRVKPGRLEDFLKHQDEIKAVNERHGLKSRRILRASLAGPNVGEVLIISEFEDLDGYAGWVKGRSGDPEYQTWQKTTPNSNPDAPTTLLSTMLLTDITR